MLTKLYLANCLKSLSINTSKYNEYRLLGAIETTLINFGVFTPSQPFKYKQIDYYYWFFYKKTRRETYREMIIREAETYLKETE